MGDLTPQGHALDSDVILGDNGNILRLVSIDTVACSVFLTFQYDNYDPSADPLRIIPRATELIDYTLGGLDFDSTADDRGAADTIHGEAGDDTIYGQVGNDVLYGEGQDDDLIGGYGHDWISAGTGDDGVVGDDGRIYTSRNIANQDESLYGLEAVDVDEFISTPGKIQQATIHLNGELKKTVNLTPFNVAPDNAGYQDPNYNAQYADDIIFGGLGHDFLHGGPGDDAISGAEAMDVGAMLIFPDDETSDATRTDGQLETTGYSVPYNPGHALGFEAYRAGEFALYDEFAPLESIAIAGTDLPYFLLVDAHDPDAPPIPGAFDVNTGTQIRSDGRDRIFGDLGNDWLVGGTDQDRVYGGYGNDLLDLDDDKSTPNSDNVPGINDQPDGPQASYEDMAYGGAGRDVLIGNTGGDRLIDWVGEFNSYLVPFAPFGTATVSRTLQPQLADYLYDISASDGADPTRALDAGTAVDRNGEPEGELGLVLQQDAAWQSQTGAPDDPQAGNIPGGKRDVLRGADFNNGSHGFFVDSGQLTIQNGRLSVASTSEDDDAAAVFHLEDALPGYYEIRATINASKPLAGAKSNTYLIYDYQGKEDFKFAGINVSTDKIQIGHRDASGWVVDAQANAQLKPDQDYQVLLAINGVNATLVVDGQHVFSHSFPARVVDGMSFGLNTGMVGLGADNATANLDNVFVQVLPPEITMEETETFDAAPAPRFVSESGAWRIDNSRLEGDASTAEGVNRIDLGQSLASGAILVLETSLQTSGAGGFVFDYYGPADYKFVAFDSTSSEIILGHRRRDGLNVDGRYAVTSSSDDDQLKITLRGSTVSVEWNGQAIGGHAYNAVVVDGQFGLLAQHGITSFDTVIWGTDDPAFE